MYSVTKGAAEIGVERPQPLSGLRRRIVSSRAHHASWRRADAVEVALQVGSPGTTALLQLRLLSKMTPRGGLALVRSRRQAWAGVVPVAIGPIREPSRQPTRSRKESHSIATASFHSPTIPTSLTSKTGAPGSEFMARMVPAALTPIMWLSLPAIPMAT